MANPARVRCAVCYWYEPIAGEESSHNLGYCLYHNRKSVTVAFTRAMDCTNPDWRCHHHSWIEPVKLVRCPIHDKPILGEHCAECLAERRDSV